MADTYALKVTRPFWCKNFIDTAVGTVLYISVWLGRSTGKAGTLPAEGSDVRILHPDPPLGAVEKLVLEQVLALGRKGGNLDILTPRLLAARGG